MNEINQIRKDQLLWLNLNWSLLSKIGLMVRGQNVQE